LKAPEVFEGLGGLERETSSIYKADGPVNPLWSSVRGVSLFYQESGKGWEWSHPIYLSYLGGLFSPPSKEESNEGTPQLPLQVKDSLIRIFREVLPLRLSIIAGFLI
jgi:hypothetical protein